MWSNEIFGLERILDSLVFILIGLSLRLERVGFISEGEMFFDLMMSKSFSMYSVFSFISLWYF